MKILRRIASVLLCVILTLPLFSFAGCTGIVVKKVLAATAKQAISAIGLELELAMESTDDGVTDALGFALDGTFNVHSVEGDLTLETSNVKNGKTQTNYSYAFLRGSELFTAEAAQELVSFDGVLMETASLDLLGSLTNGLQLDTLYKPEEMQELMQQELVETVAFFDFMGVIEANDEEITIDLNAFIYELLADCKSVIDSLKSETTLRGILEHRTVVKYGEHFLRDIDVEELKEDIGELAEELKNAGGDEELAGYISALKEVPAPLFANSYKYLVEIVFSKEMETLLKHVGATQMPSEITFADTESVLKTALGPEWKTELFKYFEKTTKEEFVLTVDDGEDGAVDISLKDMALKLALNGDHTVRSMAVQGSFVMTQKTNALSLTLSAKQTFFAEEQTLTNIDNAVVKMRKLDTSSSVLPYASAFFEVEGKTGDSWYMDYRLYPIYSKGELAGFSVTYSYAGEEYSLPAKYNKANGLLTFRAGFTERGMPEAELDVKALIYYTTREYEGETLAYLRVEGLNEAEGSTDSGCIGRFYYEEVSVAEYLA